MAKKTNKTEHVLNLLMSQSETEDDGIKQAAYADGLEKAAEAAENAPLLQTRAEAPVHAGSAASSHAGSSASSHVGSSASSHVGSSASSHNVMFVDSLQSEDHPISNAIKESLEREAIQMGLLPPNPLKKAASAYMEAGNTGLASKDAAHTASASKDAAHTASASKDAANTASASKDAANTASASKDAAHTASASKDAAHTASASKDTANAESATQKACSNAVPKDEPMPAYRYINVMESGVAESLMEYMTKLGVCTCDRCQKDVTALAMSNLPPKYIVADTAAVSPLLSFYRNKYSSHIMTELTKACFAVIADPRH